jgi:hypothetical protein
MTKTILSMEYDFQIACEKLVYLLDQQPDQKKIQHDDLGNEYLPVGVVETTLDELFMGLWQTKNYTAHFFMNEIVASIELGIYHPVLKQWIWRSGAAAQPIQQDAGSTIEQMSKKKKNALQKDYPKLHSGCIKSAAKSFGRAFGRNLNRNHVSSYTPGTTQLAVLNKKIAQAEREINEANDKKELMRLFDEYKSIPGLPVLINEKVTKLTSDE